MLDLPPARVFNSQEEATAYETAERAKGLQAMEDQCLIALALAGDHEPDCRAIWQELESRATRGSLFCQRGLIVMLATALIADRVTSESFFEAAEPFARMAAESGEDRDLGELAGVCAVRASRLRSLGREEEAHELEVEALNLLGRIANESDRPASMVKAVADYQALAQMFPDAATEAGCDLWVRSLSGSLRDEWEVADLKRQKGEA